MNADSTARCHISFLPVVNSIEPVTVIRKQCEKIKYDTFYNWCKQWVNNLKNSRLKITCYFKVPYNDPSKKQYRWKDKRDKTKRKRSKQLLDDLRETTGSWKLKEEEVDSTLWRTGFRWAMDHFRKTYSTVWWWCKGAGDVIVKI